MTAPTAGTNAIDENEASHDAERHASRAANGSKDGDDQCSSTR